MGRRVGVAVSDSDQHVAVAVTTVLRSGDRVRDHRRLAGLTDEYDAVGVVIGLPRSLSGAIGPAARGVLEEVAQLSATVGAPLATVDERLTTAAVQKSLIGADVSRAKRKTVVDKLAAAMILETYLARARA